MGVSTGDIDLERRQRVMGLTKRLSSSSRPEEYRAHEIKESNKKEKRNWHTIHDHPAPLPLVEGSTGHICHLNPSLSLSHWIGK